MFNGVELLNSVKTDQSRCGVVNWLKSLRRDEKTYNRDDHPNIYRNGGTSDNTTDGIYKPLAYA